MPAPTARLAQRALAAAAAAIVLIGGLALAPAPAHAAPLTPRAAGPVAAAAGTGRLEFGLANDASSAALDWMKNSGVPWGYRYQYLSGGVNTGGWETWNPNGDFALYYMQASTAAPANYVPVLTYYEICQSAPALCKLGDAASDYSNLTTPATMAAYYANWALLMQKAAAYGRTVIVHVEPDFWGYMQQRAAGGTAADVPASVASSGYPGLAGFPDTVQGFAHALLHLRDVTAPNVRLAVHASPWASGVDIGSDTSSTVSATGEADRTAAFLASAGLAASNQSSTWDLVFNDVLDRDSGFYEKQYGANRWWDRTNQSLPNFSRYLAWVSELHVRTGRPQVVWQVPAGNQYYRTMDNTWGHYQDNRAEYFLSHPADLWNAGLIAVLFGGGAAGTSGYLDAGSRYDPGSPTTDAWGACNQCNVHPPDTSDQDGGYLRTFVGRYYQSPYPPASSSPPAVYHPLAPGRILDTRSGIGSAGPLAGGEIRALQVAGQLGLPGTGVTSVVLNVTVTGGSASSYLTLWPTGRARPTASSLNWTPGQTVPNLVTVSLGADGAVDIYNFSGSVDVIADVAGYYSAPAGGSDGLYHPLAPQRLLDTRNNNQAPFGPGETRTLGVVGNQVPADAEAVVLNVTVTATTGSGYLTVWPADAPRPVASNLNWTPGTTVPNRVAVKVGQGAQAGQVAIYNFAGSAHVVVDIGGYYTSPAGTGGGAKLISLNPTRILDTRDSGAPLQAGESRAVAVAGINGAVPPLGSLPAPQAVVLNVTVTGGTGSSFLTVYPSDLGSVPQISDLNWTPGATQPNMVLVKLGPDGNLRVYNLAGTVHVVVDVDEWFG